MSRTKNPPVYSYRWSVFDWCKWMLVLAKSNQTTADRLSRPMSAKKHRRSVGLTGDNERIYNNRRVVHAVGDLQRPGPSCEQWGSSQPVGARVKGTKGVVESEAPIGQIGEEREGTSRVVRPPMCAIPSKGSKQRYKCIKRKQSANGEKHARREYPGRLVSVCGVKSAPVGGR
jgi:hypothetical protein